MTIVVTGGAGFIGCNFVLGWLADSNETVINLDKLTYAGKRQNLSSLRGNSRHVFIQGDICDSQLVDQILADYQPRAVINFAAESHVDRSINGPAEFIQTNIVGTYNLLESVNRYLSSVPKSIKDDFRFLHVSTDEVYGSLAPDELPFVETSRYVPNNPYSASKAASDHLINAWHNTYGVPTIITNCSNNYGPYQFPEKLVPLTITNALAGKELPVYGDGLQVRDWLYVEDHCRAIRLVLDKGKIDDTYNIGGWNEKTNLEVINTLCLLLDECKPKSDGGKYAEQITHVADRPGHDRRYAINADKIASELGWKPLETFETGIRKTLLWYLQKA